MILILDLCSKKLSCEEFVRPIVDIATTLKKEYEIKKYDEAFDPTSYSHIILCGTALQDNAYLKNIAQFEWLRAYDGKVLGICAGMQVIVTVFGGDVLEKKEIGVIPLKNNAHNIKEAYMLHNHACSLPDSFTATVESDDAVQGIQHSEKNITAFLFHPEVLNKKLIIEFLADA